MKYLLRRIVALALGLGLTGVVIAGPPQAPVRWGPATHPSGGFQPVAYQQPTPAVTLDRPVPIQDVMPLPEPLPNHLPQHVDSALQPARFLPSNDLNMSRPPAMRQDTAQMSPGMFNWKPTSGVAENPTPGGAPAGMAPMPKGMETGPMPKADPLPNPMTSGPATTMPLPVSPMPMPVPSYVPGHAVPGTIVGAPVMSGQPIMGTPYVSGPPVPAPPGNYMPCPPGGCAPPMATSCGIAGVPCGTSVPPCWVDGASTCYTPWSTFYVSAEYLMWWTSGPYAPPLATTGVPDASGFAGRLGDPNTVILHGGDSILNGMRSGVRFSSGLWLDENRCFGLDGSFFYLGDQSENFFVSSAGNPFLSRPFINANPGGIAIAPDGTQVVLPTQASGVQVTANEAVSGAINVEHNTKLWGGDLNFRTNIFCCPNTYIDMLIGWRTMTLEDQTRISEFVAGANAGGPVNFSLTDEFNTRNVFNGAQIGFVGEHLFYNRWTLGWNVKMGMGVTRQEAAIYGSTVISGAGAGLSAGTYPGGLLTQTSNIGSYSRSVFSVVPEVQLSLGYQINPHLRAFVGYNFMYWSNVARASEQINLRVNPGFLAPFRPGNGPNEPSFNWNSSGFWAQGINFGLAFNW